MNIRDILSSEEQILYQGQQHRLVPGGHEINLGKLAVTNQRIILESTSMLGLKKDFEDLHYSDILGIDLKQNVFSSDLAIRSRFQGTVTIKAIGKKDAPKLEKIVSEYVNQY